MELRAHFEDTPRVHGILLVDKPRGITSHDVVWRVRRAVSDRTVGHAGTLDPMATGLLVVLIGHATRLSTWLTLDRKRYLTTVRFGATTHSLDADGTVTAQMPDGTASPTREAVCEAVARSVGPMQQVPPAVSAIKVDGVPMHARVRRGEDVALDARAVTLEAAAVCDVREGECDLDLTVSKGFYVRSYARDLADALGTLGHLTALRRVASGAFTVDDAVEPALLERAAQRDPEAQSAVRARVLPLTEASRAMRTATVDDDTARALSQGKKLPTERDEGVLLVFDQTARPVAVCEVHEGVLRVLRGFGGPWPTE